jgi:hypothetical protein
VNSGVPSSSGSTFPRIARYCLTFPPVIGFRDKRRGIVAGLSMFVLGTLLDVSAGLKEQRFRRF